MEPTELVDQTESDAVETDDGVLVEDELLEELYGTSPIPAGFGLGAALAWRLEQ